MATTFGSSKNTTTWSQSPGLAPLMQLGCRPDGGEDPFELLGHFDGDGARVGGDADGNHVRDTGFGVGGQ